MKGKWKAGGWLDNAGYVLVESSDPKVIVSFVLKYNFRRQRRGPRDCGLSRLGSERIKELIPACRRSGAVYL
jgi:hypothetical protein